MATTRPRLLSLLILLILALALAACDFGPTGSPTPTAVSGGSGVATTGTSGTSGTPGGTDAPTPSGESSTGSSTGVSGGATEVVTPGTDAPDVPYEPAAEKLRNAKSYHFVLVRTNTLQGRKIDTTVEGDIDRPGNKLRYTLSSASEGEPIQSGKAGEWVQIGDKSYHKVNDAWTEEAAPTIITDLKDVNLLAPQEVVSMPKLIASEMVGGEDSSHYQYTSQYKGIPGATYDTWVSKETGEIVRVKATVPDGNTGFTATITALDEPVTIEAP